MSNYKLHGKCSNLFESVLSHLSLDFCEIFAII